MHSCKSQSLLIFSWWTQNHYQKREGKKLLVADNKGNKITLEKEENKSMYIMQITVRENHYLKGNISRNSFLGVKSVENYTTGFMDNVQSIPG